LAALVRPTFALIAAALVASGVAAAQPAKAPAQVVGIWSRTVTKADLQRKGGADVVTTGKWRLRIEPSGAYSLFNAPGAPIATGLLTTGAAGTLTVLRLVDSGGGECGGRAVYRWRVAGGRLTLARTSADSCVSRAAILVGTWRKS
jgi:hypothetical protein